MQNVQGTVLWYAKAVVDNVGNIGQALRNNYWRYPACNSYAVSRRQGPKKPRKVKPVWTGDGYVLCCFGRGRKAKHWETRLTVLSSTASEPAKSQLDDPSDCNRHGQDAYRLPYVDGGRNTPMVTALDGGNEKVKAKGIALSLIPLCVVGVYSLSRLSRKTVQIGIQILHQVLHR